VRKLRVCEEVRKRAE